MLVFTDILLVYSYVYRLFSRSKRPAALLLRILRLISFLGGDGSMIRIYGSEKDRKMDSTQRILVSFAIPLRGGLFFISSTVPWHPGCW